MQPPQDQSETFTFQPEIRLHQPVTDSVVSGVVEVVGSADAPAFASYELQYGISHDPGAFSAPIAGPFNTPVRDGVLGLWDTTGLGEGPHTLRLVVRDTFGSEYEVRVKLFVSNPTPTPPPTLSPTWTPEATLTATPTTLVETPVPVVDTPTETPTALPVEIPTDTPTPAVILVTDTPIPTDTPTITPTLAITAALIITGSEVITSP